MSYELYLPPELPRRNAVTGQFLPGHVPANKGKHWSDYLSKRKQKRCAKGWANLQKHRPTTRPDTAGRARKQVIAVMDDGRWLVFPYVGAAAEWVGGSRENVGRCCRQNQSRREKQHDWAPGQPRGTSRVNTDHRYLGIRFYFETDPTWMRKIKL